MKLATGTFLVISAFAQFSHAQTNPNENRSDPGAPTTASLADTSSNGYTVFNATTEQEAALRAQIRFMHPSILPLRVFFVPHWKYLASARDFHLHVPTGYGSLMFTHLPSRTVFIDNDRYTGEDWLAHWIAHELGHLVANSTKEEDAEKAAREFRRRLDDGRKQTALKPLRSASQEANGEVFDGSTRN